MAVRQSLTQRVKGDCGQKPLGKTLILVGNMHRPREAVATPTHDTQVPACAEATHKDPPCPSGDLVSAMVYPALADGIL